MYTDKITGNVKNESLRLIMKTLNQLIISQHMYQFPLLKMRFIDHYLKRL